MKAVCHPHFLSSILTSSQFPLRRQRRQRKINFVNLYAKRLAHPSSLCSVISSPWLKRIFKLIVPLKKQQQQQQQPLDWIYTISFFKVKFRCDAPPLSQFYCKHETFEINSVPYTGCARRKTLFAWNNLS